MFVGVMDYIMAISMAAFIVWYWLAFVAEMIARRKGTTSRIPWPDEVLWARVGRTLLDSGLYGGAPVPKLPLQRYRSRMERGRPKPRGGARDAAFRPTK